LTIDYRVHLDAFEGPLDLLLYLIRRAEVDITDIPIAQITEQYLDYLKQIETIDIELAGEFLVTAATLMEIKSRMLAPVKPGAEAGEAMPGAEKPGDDPRAELVKQLLAYKQFRDAATALEARKQEWEQRFAAGKAGIDSESLREVIAAQAEDLELEDLHLNDLVEAFAQIAASVNFERLGEHQVTYDDTPIELHAEDIVDRLRRESEAGRGAVALPALFVGRKKGEMIGLFLATLELVRRRAVRVRQEETGVIVLELRGPEAEPPAEAASEAPPPEVTVVEGGVPAALGRHEEAGPS
jgi:segregation and condensation protein A